MNDLAIDVKDLNKIYKLYDKPTDRLKEALSFKSGQLHKEFYALKDLSFSVTKGETVGIIGTNGSGKSTLLKILTGVLNESSGSAVVSGKVSALLELGAGFNPEYTGIENIYLNGTIMGYKKEEMDERVQAIVDFADIGEFVYQPVKTYSSGMFVRLAFAAQIYSDPDILIVDEALSVGDMRFQQKCYRAMEDLMKDKTVILVTHDPAAISRFCNRAIWLEKGELMYDGESEVTLKKYQTFLLNNMKLDGEVQLINCAAKDGVKYYTVTEIISSAEKAGTGEADIVKCGLFSLDGNKVEDILPGKEYMFAMDVHFKKLLEKCIVGVTIKDRLGNTVLALNSYMSNVNVDTVKLECQYQLKIKCPPLNTGEYTISPAIAIGSIENHYQLCWVHDAVVFRVSKKQFALPGLIYLEDGFEFLVHEYL